MTASRPVASRNVHGRPYRTPARLAACAALAVSAPAFARQALPPVAEREPRAAVSAPILGDRLGGFVLPTEPGTWPVVISAVEANAWKVETTQRLQLRGKVRVMMGTYDFTSESAVAWIERIPTAKGLVTQLAFWFPDTLQPTRAAGLGAGGSNLFVTASTFGEVSMSAVLLDPKAPAANPELARAHQRMAAYLAQLSADPPALRILPEVIRPPSLLRRRPSRSAPSPPSTRASRPPSRPLRSARPPGRRSSSRTCRPPRPHSTRRARPSTRAPGALLSRRTARSRSPPRTSPPTAPPTP